MNHSIRFYRLLKRLLMATAVLTMTLSPSIAGDEISKEKSSAKAASVERTSTAFCACCADQGAWFQSSRSLSELDREMLAGLKFQNARLHLTSAAEEDWRGIADDGLPLDEDYALTFTPAPDHWTLTLKTKRGVSGSLILTLPARAFEFGADTSKEIPPRLPVTLYKELRLEGSARGTGIFARGNAPGAKYLLALRGEGNMCFSAGDYYRWNLRVSGPKASCAFYGLFAKTR